MLARGEAWPGDEGQEGVARRHIRAALDKVNALETEKANLVERFRNLAAVAIGYRKEIETLRTALQAEFDLPWWGPPCCMVHDESPPDPTCLDCECVREYRERCLRVERQTRAALGHAPPHEDSVSAPEKPAVQP